MFRVIAENRNVSQHITKRELPPINGRTPAKLIHEFYVSNKKAGIQEQTVPPFDVEELRDSMI